MFSRLRTLTIAAIAALFSVVLFAAPASAHDQLVDSIPAADAALTQAPTEVVLEYSSDLLDLGEASTTVIVADAAGKNWVAGAPVVDGSMLTVQLEAGLPVGGYEIRWQVISGDGHPISGVIAFTVGNAEPVVSSEPATSATSSDEPQTTGMPQPLRIVLFGLGGVAIAFALFFLSLRAIRRKRGNA